MNQVFSLIFISLIVFGCQQPASDAAPDKAQQIIDRAIKKSGGEAYEHMQLAFDFRDRAYRYAREGGLFQYERSFQSPQDSLQQIRDILTNEGLIREINGEPQQLPDTMADKYANSLNSVIYFALLPYGLNDAAVQKSYLGTSSIQGAPYHKIEVSFKEEGGGKDFDDVFIYWFHQESYTLDYLAYRFHVNGGGIRFRAAFNPREKGGIRFVDYHNYKMDQGLDLPKADSLYNAGALEKLSEIKLENISVESPPKLGNE